MKTARSVCCNLLRVHVSGLCHCSNQSPRHCGSSYAATWCGFRTWFNIWASKPFRHLKMSPKRKGTTKHFYQLQYIPITRFRSTKSIPIKPIKLITNLSVQNFPHYMGVSKNRGTPKSSILIGFSIINHPFWGYPYFWKHPYRSGSCHFIPARPIGSLVVCAIAFIRTGYPESWRKLVASQDRTWLWWN